MESQRKQRILTGSLLGGFVLVAIFLAPPVAFLLISTAACTWAAAELVRIWRHWAPGAPLGALLALVPLAAFWLGWLSHQAALSVLWTLAFPAAAVLAAALVVLWSRTPIEQGAAAIGFLAFGVPYFALPAVCLYLLHRSDPWLVLAFVAIVAAGDTSAYFVGSWIGRRHIAPRISPRKTWEGSIAGGLGGLAAIAVWCLARGEEPRLEWFALAAVTEITAQVGDLLASLAKRGAGVKDSSQLLPGHGGLYDRLDALLLAAPVFLLGLGLLDLRAGLTFALQ